MAMEEMLRFPDGPQSIVEGFKQVQGRPDRTPGYSQSP